MRGGREGEAVNAKKHLGRFYAGIVLIKVRNGDKFRCK